LVSIFLVILIEAASDRQPGKRFGRRKCSDISEMERTSWVKDYLRFFWDGLWIR